LYGGSRPALDGRPGISKIRRSGGASASLEGRIPVKKHRPKERSPEVSGGPLEVQFTVKLAWAWWYGPKGLPQNGPGAHHGVLASDGNRWRVGRDVVLGTLPVQAFVVKWLPRRRGGHTSRPGKVLKVRHLATETGAGRRAGKTSYPAGS